MAQGEGGEGRKVPITVRISADSAVRLRVHAARRGITTGRALDEILQATLPAERSARGPAVHAKPATLWTASRLAKALEELGVNQAEFARAMNLSPKAVNHWFLRGGEIPAKRHGQIDKVVADLRRKTRGKE